MAINESKTYTDSQVKRAAPRNLLDNSDFRNPVNQRGQTSYSNDGYCFDRWVIWHNNGCNVSYDSEKRCVRISSIGNTTLYQKLAKGVLDQTKKYTQAYGLTDGGIVISTRIDYSPENYDTAEGIMLSPGQTLEIAWTALYEGEYTAETLPEYRPKGYGAELAECQRYYRKITAEDNTVICQAIAYNSTSLWGTLPFSMRISNPTIKFDNIIWTSNSISGASTVSSIGVNTSSCGITCVVFRVDGAVECTTYNIWTSGTGGYLEINADL